MKITLRSYIECVLEVGIVAFVYPCLLICMPMYSIRLSVCLSVCICVAVAVCVRRRTGSLGPADYAEDRAMQFIIAAAAVDQMKRKPPHTQTRWIGMNNAALSSSAKHDFRFGELKRKARQREVSWRCGFCSGPLGFLWCANDTDEINTSFRG